MKNYFYFLLFFFLLCTANAQTITSKKATIVFWPKLTKEMWKSVNVYTLLKKKLATEGYILDSQDKHPPEESDLVLVAYPHYTVPEGMKEKSFLWLLETPISIQIPPSAETEKRYKKIFTYNQDLAKKENYILLPIPYNYSPIKPYNKDLKKVLVAQVAGYRKNNNPKNKYEQRTDDVKWFLENHPEDILFAGHGNWINDFRVRLPKELQNKFDDRYKGIIKNKIDFLAQAKFGLAYENTQFNGYITEKIYDVMTANTVPIYLGAFDIEKYIPKACFINRQDFKTEKEMYSFLKNMSDEKYHSYIECIQVFLSEYPEKQNTPKAISDRIFFELFQESNTTKKH